MSLDELALSADMKSLLVQLDAADPEQAGDIRAGLLKHQRHREAAVRAMPALEEALRVMATDMNFDATAREHIQGTNHLPADKDVAIGYLAAAKGGAATLSERELARLFVANMREHHA